MGGIKKESVSGTTSNSTANVDVSGEVDRMNKLSGTALKSPVDCQFLCAFNLVSCIHVVHCTTSQEGPQAK
jgi:hypothetical protein